MRTQIFKAFKNALILSTTALLLVSCGKKNTSGGSSNDSIDSFGLSGSKGGRRIVSFPLQGVNSNAGAIYVGVTSFGDIAYVQGKTITIEVCPRSGMNGQGSTNQPVLMQDSMCLVGVLVMDAQIGGPYGAYDMKFAPLSVHGSSLCGGYNNSLPSTWKSIIRSQHPCAPVGGGGYPGGYQDPYYY